ncbi:308_t:CDS:2, partial [Cetraspora pellucida]
MVLTKNLNYNRKILFHNANNKWKKYKKDPNIQRIIDEFFNTPVPLQGFPILYIQHSTQSINNNSYMNVTPQSMPFSNVVFETNLDCNNEKANNEYEELEIGN